MNQVRKYLRKFAKFFEPIKSYDHNSFHYYLWRSQTYQFRSKSYLQRFWRQWFLPKPESKPVRYIDAELHDLEAEYGQTIVDMAMLMDDLGDPERIADGYLRGLSDYEKLEKLSDRHKIIINKQFKQIGVNKRRMPYD